MTVFLIIIDFIDLNLIWWLIIIHLFLKSKILKLDWLISLVMELGIQFYFIIYHQSYHYSLSTKYWSKLRNFIWYQTYINLLTISYLGFYLPKSINEILDIYRNNWWMKSTKVEQNLISIQIDHMMHDHFNDLNFYWRGA